MQCTLVYTLSTDRKKCLQGLNQTTANLGNNYYVDVATGCVTLQPVTTTLLLPSRKYNTFSVDFTAFRRAHACCSMRHRPRRRVTGRRKKQGRVDRESKRTACFTRASSTHNMCFEIINPFVYMLYILITICLYTTYYLIYLLQFKIVLYTIRFRY